MLFGLMNENEDVVSAVAQLLEMFDINMLFSNFKHTLQELISKLWNVVSKQDDISQITQTAISFLSKIHSHKDFESLYQKGEININHLFQTLMNNYNHSSRTVRI